MFSIVCPNCQFSKKYPAERLPEKAVKVKCPSCNLGFIFEPGSTEAKINKRKDNNLPPEHLDKSARNNTHRNKRLFLFVGLLLVLIGSYAAFNYSNFVNESAPPSATKGPGNNSEKKVKKNIPEKPTIAVASKLGQQLNPSAMAPVNMFKVFYINTTDPKMVVASAYQESASVNYIHDQLHGIPSKDFGAYWVGNFEFKDEVEREISVAQSHAETRIYIDGQEVFGSKTKRNIHFKFTKGLHTIEVEYANNWHTTDLLVNILPVVPMSTKPEAMVAIENVNRQEKTKYWVASVYDSDEMDHQIQLSLKESKTPVILFLASYGPVNWNISGAEKAKLKMVLYSSYKMGSSIKVGPAVPTYKISYKNLTLAYTLVPKCSESGNRMHCEGEEDFPRLMGQIDQLTNGKKPDGFTGVYDGGSLSVPEVILDQDRYKNIQQQRNAIERRKKELASRSIDKVFN
ncbi:MAG: hypothetical protein C0623_13955 [Desulfuromonas sp.]|nr:MAG: hypothetical protein C0623_13955 [Desulfuromonas sp.]